MASLEICLLGGLQVRHDNAAVTQFISSKAPALLAYLAISRRPHQRDALANLLWGEMPEAAAANNLRQTLTNLRKFFDPHLLITRETVAFNLEEPHCVDVADLLAGLCLQKEPATPLVAAQLAQALALYRGDFLEGFFVRDAPDFEEWALAQQVTLREATIQGWSALVDMWMNLGEYGQAVTATGRLLALDPWREEAHCLRMLALARSGQSSAALAQYQICRKILAQEFDAEPAAETTALYQRIRSASRAPRHNLPGVTTGFVGRETELADLRRLLAAPDTRLLTLWGPGGVGKTRLAIAAAQAAAPSFLHGVCFLSLSENPAQSSASLPTALAAALALPATTQASQQQVLDFLRQKEILLVLDNLEDWMDAVAWLSDLLVHALDVKVIATSRHRLNLQAERLFPIRGLPVPALHAGEPESSAAMQLFLRRARRVQADFPSNGTELAAVARICRAVEGLPLAIELAAAWVHQLTCAEIADQIEGNLDFLATGRQDVTPRQRSLRAVFDWSWARLSPAEQAAFQGLAVFSGPFSRAAAQEVAGASLPILSALVDKSLAWRRGDLYQLHEVARQFGWDKLEQAAAVQSIRARHAHHYAQLLAQRAEHFKDQYLQAALEEIEREVDNVQAAWQWLVQQPDVVGIGVAMDGLYHFTAIRGRLREGLDLFSAAQRALLPLADSSPVASLTYSRAAARAGRFLSYLSQYAQAQALFQESLARLEAAGERDEVAFVLGHLGGTARMQGDMNLANQHLHASLALRRETGNLHGQAVTLLELAGVAFMTADYATALARCQEGLTIAERAGDRQTVGHLLTGLSLSHRELGDFAAALAFGRRGLAIYTELNDKYGVIQALLTLGELSRQQGDAEEARRFCQQAVQVSQEIGYPFGEADGVYRLGQIAAGLGRRDEALSHFRTALALAQDLHEISLVLDILLEIGCLLVVGSQRVQGAAILTVLLAQPQMAEPLRQRAAQSLQTLPADWQRDTHLPLSLAEVAALAIHDTPHPP